MALRINPFLKVNNDTGFGNHAAGYGGRFVNKNGTFNVRREGQPLFDRFSVFQWLMHIPPFKFLLVVLIFFVLVNIIYTGLYAALGPHALQGFQLPGVWGRIREIFYFSCQTFTTVGYGRVNPVGDLANLLASFEALTGFFFFAVITGLVYGRFTKPKANLQFSRHALVAPYQGGMGLMFRFATKKDNHTLTEVRVKVSLGLQVVENGAPAYKFYSLKLERDRIDSLPMNLTVVHPLDAESPLLGYSAEDMLRADVELYVLVSAYDDVYNTNVQQRTSYVAEELIYNARFVPMYNESPDGRTTWLEMDKLDKYDLTIGL